MWGDERLEAYQRHTNTVCRETFSLALFFALMSVSKFKNVPIQNIFKITGLMKKSDYTVLLTVSCEFKTGQTASRCRRAEKTRGKNN